MPRRRAPPKNPDPESESEVEIESESESEEIVSDVESEEIVSDVESEEIVSDVESDVEEEEESAPPPKKGKKAVPAKKAAPAKGPVKSKAKKDGGSEDNEDEEPGKRYFKIIVDSIETENSPPVPIGTGKDELSPNGGRYTGKNPMQAAKKAFTRISRVAAPGGECTYIFTIVETTKTSSKKEFKYIGIRKELDEPQEVKKIDKKSETESVYEIRFSSEVKSYKPDKKAPAKKAPAKKAPAKKAPAKKAPAKKAPARSTTRGRAKAK